MSDTTNLADLPMEPTSGAQNDANVVIQPIDKPQYHPPSEVSQQPQINQSIDEQKMMNEFVTGIQHASASGATKLPSRDIPQNTVHFADEQVQPNFVPEKEHPDYIQNNDSEQEILARRIKNQNSRDSLEILYDEFQIPIIIGLLFFIFQLPIVKSKLLSVLPSLYNSDGNPNLTGYIFTSLFFGICYYIISKSLTHFQTI
jgi:hypothetical protein